MSESEMLWKSFHGNEEAMQKAITKGDLNVNNGKFYWQHEVHEHITGGQDTFQGSFGEQHMSTQDMQKFMEVMNWAPWAEWGVTPNNVPKAELKNVAKPGSDAMTKAHECLDASKAVCIAMKNVFKQAQKDGILAAPDAGSIPAIMATAMKKVKEMENDHMQPIAAIIYDTDGTCSASVKDVKEKLNAAALTVKTLTQHMNEVKALVQKHKSAASKKQKPPHSTD